MPLAIKSKPFVVTSIALACGALLVISLFKRSFTPSPSSVPMSEEVNSIASMEGRMAHDAHYKRLLFVDQSLEELIAQYNTKDPMLVEPFKLLQNGNSEAAKQSLRQILVSPAAELRHKIWAWNALRQLNETPPPDVKDKVQGVIFEIPVNGWVDTLAVYSDGRARYMNGKLGAGGLLIWEDVQNPQVNPLIMQVISSAQTLVGQVPVVDNHKEEAPNSEPRITVLTYDGLYIVDRNISTRHLTDPVLSTGTNLFVTLMRISEENQ